MCYDTFALGTVGADECNGEVTTADNPSVQRVLSSSAMEAKGLTPILNVSDIASTVVWFEKWGWKKLWEWGTPPFHSLTSADGIPESYLGENRHWTGLPTNPRPVSDPRR